MHWSSAASTSHNFETALDDVATRVEEELGGVAPQLLAIYISSSFRESYVLVASRLRARFPGAAQIGCSAAGFIGGGRELEQTPGVSLTAAALPGVTLHPFHVGGHALARWSEDPTTASEDLRALDERLDGDIAGLILHPDPVSCDTSALLRVLDERYPGATKIGGVASGGNRPGHNALYAGGRAHGTGVVGLAFAGALSIDSVVAQGCRPIGAPMFITRCDGNVIRELDGRSPVATVQELYEQLEARDRVLMRNSLFIGVVTEPDASRYGPGDFLVRSIIGFDPNNSALAVDAQLSTGQVVQFHLRDRQASAQDLNAHLDARAEALAARPPAGALLFSCLGRGKHLYGRPNHDSDALRERARDA
ncbi:MAG: FIST C-terminal domain-containing protein, partial [Myxococcales bacterium]|nr:FIST C-terminal domain-containing protein [Myxococcales bacterium]